ncbi:MAG TPA: antibiotic biosynthesis monooxygenase [Candidatus Avidehalobacter gallistercoris]|uniref:Antibiotic biosynthesis monooxygenase n=1 Tax=Candidatus Avidehalobacter gallistercoris TaxID=2840694 RepID=A0A9D1KYA5_9FIRM|nr:antibiotic biosynthesis monooxygenase [Candidatus Avidehalobacter gallistercoris]
MSNIIVLFEVTVKSGKMDDYLKMAGFLKDSLVKAEGFIRSERFSSLATEGKLLSMSVWENEACVSKWRNFAAHRMAQKHGRMNDFADYKITVATPVRTYTMTDRTEAPADSDEYLEV